MPIEYSAAPAQSWYRHHAKDPVVKAGSLIRIFHESILPEIESIIVNHAFLCPPPELISAKTSICDGGPAKVKRHESFAFQMTNGLPHHEVVTAEAQVVLMRSAKLVICPCTLMQKDSAS